MRLRLFGRAGAIGGGVHFSEFTAALRSLAIIGDLVDEMDVHDESKMARASIESRPDDINIWFWPHQAAPAFKGTKILWAIFESTRLPESYLKQFQYPFDILWVPSDWGRSVLLANGVSAAKIDVVPEGVNPNRFHPFFRQPPDTQSRPYRFLTVGKFETRKGYTELLEAFNYTFKDSSQVELIVKPDYFVDAAAKRLEFERWLSHFALTNVKTIWGQFASEYLLALYSSVDAFVFPSRSEGWGLTLLEAMACGLPVITTYYSGHTQFIEPVRHLTREIEFDLVKIDSPDFTKYWLTEDGNLGAWAKARPQSIADALHEFVDNPFIWYQRGLETSELVRRRFTWRQAAEIGVHSLRVRNLIPSKLELKLKN